MAKEKEMGIPREMGMSREMSSSNGGGGHLYMQTNEAKNVVIHYHRSSNGTLTEVERVATWGCRFRNFQADQRPGERAQLL